MNAGKISDQNLGRHVGLPTFNFAKEIKTETGASLVVQWLRLHAPRAGGPGSIPGQRTRSRIQQLRVCMLQLRPSTAKNTKAFLKERKLNILKKKKQPNCDILSPLFHTQIDILMTKREEGYTLH